MKNLFMDFIKVLIFSIILTLIALVVLSLVLSFSEVSESVINPAIIVISSVSILIGGFLVAKKIKKSIYYKKRYKNLFYQKYNHLFSLALAVSIFLPLTTKNLYIVL